MKVRYLQFIGTSARHLQLGGELLKYDLDHQLAHQQKWTIKWTAVWTTKRPISWKVKI